MQKKETVYQAKLITKLKELFPGCHIQKNDPSQNQGIPDLLILFRKHWAFLEVKLSKKASKQANQEHFIKMFNDMSFASFICPENEEEVLNGLSRVLGKK